MATARTTVGSVFGSVASIATTVTSTFETVNVALSVANSSVSTWAKTQEIRNKLNAATAQERVLIEKSREITELRMEVIKEGEANQEWKGQFDKAHSDLSALLK